MMPAVAIADRPGVQPYGENPPWLLKFALWKPEMNRAITVSVGTTNLATVRAPLTRANSITPNQLSSTNTAMMPAPSSTPSAVRDEPLYRPPTYLLMYWSMAADSLGGLVAEAIQIPQPAMVAPSRPLLSYGQGARPPHSG